MQEFPQMIFHVVEPPMVVKDKQELEKYLSQGWAMTSQEFDQIKMVQAKIAYHESEVARLQEILDGMDVPKEAEKFICDCGFEAKSNAGLAAHKRNAHKE